MLFRDGDRILFTGDSVTDANRKRPVGEGLGEGVGNGYVRAIDTCLNVAYPEMKLHIMNTGVSGNTSRDLLARMEEDVLALDTDYVVFMIGINDVWRQFDEPGLVREHVGLAAYSQNVADFIDRVQAGGRTVIFMTPYFIESNRADLMRMRVEEYASAAARICQAKGVRCIELQPVFDEYLRHRHSSYLTWDRVHPGPIGSALIACAFLREIGFDPALL